MKNHWKLLCVLLSFIALSSFAFEAMAIRFEPAIDKKKPCCNLCLCALSYPPKCQCTDIKPYCEDSCEKCICTKSIPPQCRCVDILDHCRPPQCIAPSFDPWNVLGVKS